MYKEIIDLKNRSRNYRVQKEKLSNYRENSPYLSDPRYLMRTGTNLETNAKAKMEYDFIHFEIALLTENIESVERDFKLIERISGTTAAEAIKKNFIDGESWEHIAELNKRIKKNNVPDARQMVFGLSRCIRKRRHRTAFLKNT